MIHLLGVIVGWLGGTWHLGITALRARALGSGRMAPALALLPLAVMGPIAAVAAMIWLAPDAVWAVLPGLFLARLVLLRPLAQRVGDPWTP